MSNVFLVSGDESADAQVDDHLVRLSGDDAEIARVTASGPEWLGAVPASSLGSLSGQGQVDDPQVLIAVQGAASALVERGG